jgi:uncharacterized membrane protein HdeD (DUF308 family)
MAQTADGMPGLKTALHDHWKLFLIEGIVLIVLGSAAIVVPAVASIAVALVLGWLFLIGGIVGLATSFAGRAAPGFWWALISTLVSIAAGVLLLAHPLRGTITLTFVLTAFLVVDGVLTILFAIEHRRQLSQRWIWLLINGVLDLVLAAIIVLALPLSAEWALGLIVGIDLVFGGWSLVAMAMAARSAA